MKRGCLHMHTPDGEVEMCAAFVGLLDKPLHRCYNDSASICGAAIKGETTMNGPNLCDPAVMQALASAYYDVQDWNRAMDNGQEPDSAPSAETVALAHCYRRMIALDGIIVAARASDHTAIHMVRGSLNYLANGE